MTEYSTPGQLIADLLRDRGWSARALALVLQKDESTIAKVLSGKGSVTTETALALEDIFGVEADRFLALQRQHDLAVARLAARPDKGRATRAALFGDLPVSQMIKRGWLKAQENDLKEVEGALVRFFRAESPDEIEVLPHAAKRTAVNLSPTPSQMAWLYRVRAISEELLVPAYTTNGLRKTTVRLRTLLTSPENIRLVPRLLAESGVRLVFVETLTGAKIDGVCFWLDEVSPVIGMSLRHDRIDNFWFVLRHEIEHVLQEHGKEEMVLDIDIEGSGNFQSSISEQESVANKAAQEFCIPEAEMNGFMARKAPFFSERDLIGFSKVMGVHPGIVAGQLQHRTGRYDRFRQHLGGVRTFLTGGSVMDGWGDIYPVGE